MSQTIYDFEVKNINGESVSLAHFKGKTLLIVNVASKCGFTSQYKELEEIYREYKTQGLEILAFPCNQFGAQEPGDAEEIKNFCSLNYDVSFPLFSKVDVNGDEAAPVYQFLKESLPGILGSKAVKWNFTKFLVDKNGVPHSRYAPTDKPRDILKDIKEIL
ncbi:MAG: glutathione peroxidase [Bacteriovorax sp.]|nr:glutathione peroxidase [Bacteriovorax sp.]